MRACVRACVIRSYCSVRACVCVIRSRTCVRACVCVIRSHCSSRRQGRRRHPARGRGVLGAERLVRRCVALLRCGRLLRECAPRFLSSLCVCQSISFFLCVSVLSVTRSPCPLVVTSLPPYSVLFSTALLLHIVPSALLSTIQYCTVNCTFTFPPLRVGSLCGERACVAVRACVRYSVV